MSLFVGASVVAFTDGFVVDGVTVVEKMRFRVPKWKHQNCPTCQENFHKKFKLEASRNRPTS